MHHISLITLIYVWICICLVAAASQSCNEDDNSPSVDISLLDNFDAPLKASFDFSLLNKQIKAMIKEEVKKGVEKAIEEKVDEIVSRKFNKSVESLDALFSETVSGLRKSFIDVDTLNEKMQVFDSKVRHIQDDINEGSKYVGLTAFGTSNGKKSSGEVLLFPVIKASFNIPNLSSFKNSGKFICGESGLYVVSVTVMVCSKGDSMFSIHVNNEIYQYFIGNTNTGNGNNCNSATGTIIQHLVNGINVYCTIDNSQEYVYDNWSSFTIVKLK